MPSSDHSFIVSGPAGDIEAIVTLPNKNASVMAIICHPHPLHGGSLDNKVVHTLMRTFRELGIASIRFNFRGVGNSKGKYDDGVGEVDDLMTVVEWAKKTYPHYTLWLAGFSFGTYVATKSLLRCREQNIDIEQVVLVAPPVTHFDFAHVDFLNSAVCVIMGGQDEVVEPAAVKEWVAYHPSIHLLWLPEASHFFHGELIALSEQLKKYVRDTYPSKINND